jgi:hypothetical protein
MLIFNVAFRRFLNSFEFYSFFDCTIIRIEDFCIIYADLHKGHKLCNNSQSLDELWAFWVIHYLLVEFI